MVVTDKLLGRAGGEEEEEEEETGKGGICTSTYTYSIFFLERKYGKLLAFGRKEGSISVLAITYVRTSDLGIGYCKKCSRVLSCPKFFWGGGGLKIWQKCYYYSPVYVVVLFNLLLVSSFLLLSTSPLYSPPPPPPPPPLMLLEIWPRERERRVPYNVISSC